MSRDVKLSESPSSLEGAFAEPQGTGHVGALVVLQEWHGLNQQMRGKVDRFAHEGYLAACPDLYHGKVTTNDEEAAKLMGALDWTRAVAEIRETVAFLGRHPRSNGKVGVIGFCMGGALAFAACRHVKGLACAVPFYGIPQLPLEEYAHLKTPISAHFAGRDQWAKPSVAEEIQKQVRGGGGSMELFVYDAGHAFMRETDPAKYDAAASTLAWERVLPFLKAHLS